ncbi:hypothetical protein [Pseudogemmobacter sonorensis]|uniref:hypothetical protein n=1 Tax=Pseudogemmobacter sonorensis TaxID=2989681 RepID=UPI0036C7B575
MFDFDPDYTFEWPVKVDHPGGEKQQFIGIFRQPEDEKDLFERAEGENLADIIGEMRDRTARCLVGWREIRVKGGGELPFTEENRDRLLKIRAIRLAAYNALCEGIVGGREKN